MPRNPIPQLPLRALVPGQMADCFVLLAEKAKKATHDGRPFYACTFRDAVRRVHCLVWSDSLWFAACDREWQEGNVYEIRCTYGEHDRYGSQIDLHSVRAVDVDNPEEGVDLEQIIASSRFNVEEMYQTLVQLVEREIADAGLRNLVLHVLTTHASTLKQMPASDKFHPFRGGWLEHVLSLTRTCLFLVDHYRSQYPEARPPLNRDLVLAGAVLHDAGRLRGWRVRFGLAQPTIAGRLVGHSLLGRDVVRDAAQAVGEVHPELVELLEHVILTHLTLPKWGSPRLPMIPEVLILHHADDLDAKMEVYQRCLARDQHPGPFTLPDPVLKKPLLKGRSV